MKKIICILLTLLLICAIAVPAYAVTPPLAVPDMPEIPDISDDVEIELPDSAFEGYIPDIDIDITEPTEPTEPPDQEETCTSWHDIVNGLYQRWKDFLARLWP